MRKLYTLAVTALLFCSHWVQAQATLAYYLPKDVTYSKNIPTPQQVLGYEVGEWHVSHDQLVMYMRQMDQASDRITLAEYGRTHENRPLYLLTITSPDNHKNITQLKADHKQLTDPANSGKLDVKNMPAVVWMGYSVHGNEPSGSNAALLAVYHLAAAQGPEIDKLLKETIILVDPSINPDGLNRFASWVNTNRGKNLVTDPNSSEFAETWPRGRTNHYWFDLNRDWLPLQHPESQGRLAKFHEWKPNLLTDHHEMGTNATFFFQPGIPSRNHPLSPENAFKLTQKIGNYHAKALDKIGSLYYTEESYDDFYYGKGSTYPDVNGAVGILFEQASSRGHAQESINGVLTFPFTIRNQFATTLSTLEAAQAMREELLTHQRDFYKQSVNDSKKAGTKAYIFGSENDPARAYHLADIIRQHQIEIYKPKETIKVGNTTYSPENAYIVPLEQPQYKLIEAMFEKRTTFKDSLFYDISAWTFPLAFDLEYSALTKNYKPNQLGEKVTNPQLPTGKITGGQSAYAYAFEWKDYYAPRALNTLLNLGIQAKAATDTFKGNGKEFNYGTILIPVAGQPIAGSELYKLLEETAKANGIEVHAMATGLSSEGIKLGSPMMLNLRKPSIMLLTGDGVNSNDAGEAWHLLDNRFNIKTTLLTATNFNNANLSRYNVLVMADGSYNAISKDKLRAWVQQGGTVIGMGDAIKWLASNGISNITFKEGKNGTPAASRKSYADLENETGAQVIGGAIFETTLDLTHPLAYGYTDKQLPIFRSNTLFLEPSKNPYANPVMYTAKPLMAGYISKQNLELAKGSAAVAVTSIGSGKVIAMPDNPNFRAFWYGTNKLFLNSIFFGNIINGSSARVDEE
ncbi:M14 metallopeptidase family protein [Pontibacter sp. H259]|uniref:M14 metallopeptidase family protein n=1 Tax=Pontibacter sp. H259 TaxID=3133421 RepID=UPI0030C586EA